MTQIILIILTIIQLLNSIDQTDKSVLFNGVLDEHQWKSTRTYQIGSKAKLLLYEKSDELFGAIVSETKIWSHIYISDGETVKVMHVSAAIDAVIYKNNESLWLTNDTFQYELRNKEYNTETQQKMLEYYFLNGWVANNINLGDGKTIEFKINTRNWNAPLYFACVVADNNLNLQQFPSNLTDDTKLLRLVQGYTPDSLSFKPLTWQKIK